MSKNPKNPKKISKKSQKNHKNPWKSLKIPSNPNNPKKIPKNPKNPKKSQKIPKNPKNLSISYTFLEVIYPSQKTKTPHHSTQSKIKVCFEFWSLTIVTRIFLWLWFDYISNHNKTFETHYKTFYNSQTGVQYFRKMYKV